MKPNADLGTRINRARRSAGLTVGDLARRLDVSRTLVSDIVSGKRSPTPSIAGRLIQILDIDEDTRKALEQLTESTYTSSALDGALRLDRYERRVDERSS